MRIPNTVSLPTQQPFLVNKYTMWYYSIIENARQRKRSELSYSERHHIIPDCFFIINRSNGKRPGWLSGKSHCKNNRVRLAVREHWLCHWLLTKMVQGEARTKMLFALATMTRTSPTHQRELNIAQLTIAKESAALAARLQQKPPMSAETKRKLRLANLGKKHNDESKKKNSDSQKQRPPASIETREKLRSSALGHILSAASRAKLSASCKGRPAPNKGIPHSAATKEKMKAAKQALSKEQVLESCSVGLAIMNSKIECSWCGRKTNKGNYKRWHGDNCVKRCCI